MKLIQLYPVHVFLFAILRIIHVYADNVDETPVSDVLRLAGLATALAGIIWLLLHLLVRHARRSAVLATLVIVALYFLGELLDTPLLGVAAACGVGIVVWAAFRSRTDWSGFTRFLNIVGLIAVVWPLVTVIHYAATPRPVTVVAIEGEVDSVIGNPDQAEPPNIYHIVLDGYARGDVLRDLYEFDNFEFLDFLRARGFYVAEQSRSNYSQTFLSLASTFNFSYLDSLVEVNRCGDSSDSSIGIRSLHKNRLFELLADSNYRLVTIASGYAPTDFTFVDVRLAPAFTLREFDHAVLKHSLPLHLAGLQRRNFTFEIHRTRIREGFDNLVKASILPGRKFVFAHFVCPHPPFVFNADGSAVANPGSDYIATVGEELVEQITLETYRSRYVQQVKYINSRVEQAVVEILENDPEAVIVVQGDHGPCSEYSTNSFKKTNLHERLSILNAYRAPSAHEHLYSGISPVNSYRVILNAYFGTSLPLLPDQSFYSTHETPYDFIRAF